MSYILDALRKSDQQRQRGSTPTLLTVQATATGPKRPRYLLNSVLAAVLICAGIVVGWLQPWQMKQPAPAAVPIASMAIAPNPHLAAPRVPSGSPEMIGKLEHEPLIHESTSAAQPGHLSVSAATKQDMPAPDNNESALTSSRSDAAGQEATGVHLPGRTAATGAAAEQGKRVMALNELPPSIRQEIPNVSISFHAYSSDPRERRVMINGEMTEQGALVAPGLTLEQITPDGVILDYMGYRFHQGVR
ncbi:MAG: general secretion pathway protein GspB [Thiobacillaceae bacterium]|jgi:general secretion pathway protein B